MKLRKLETLIIVGSMILGNISPVMAESTEVGFTKGATNTAYTMTIPAGNTAIAKDGAFSSVGSVLITSEESFDEACGVVVKVNRNNYLKNTDPSIKNNNAIAYNLYTGETKNEENIVYNNDLIQFEATDIDSKTPVEMGVAITGSNYASLETGDYRDTITFTSSLLKPLELSDFMGSTTILVAEGYEWYDIYIINKDKMNFDSERGQFSIHGNILRVGDTSVKRTDLYSSSNKYTLK